MPYPLTPDPEDPDACLERYRAEQERYMREILGDELYEWLQEEMESMDSIVNEIKLERLCQDKKRGEQNHSPEWWLTILMEEVGEASKAVLEARYNDMLIDYRTELTHVATVAIAAIESFDRNLHDEHI